ncbi:MAG: L-2-hydroxyglutarate oxidase [Balneolaceae bacterium]|nr:MAG: L-2-hydroxyglutarate oxidase [Balneolaceae bacterium]
MKYDYIIIGAGIVGLATALALTRKQPSAGICIIEKEPGEARHQSGRNSGVIHSGIYYKPGSFKALFARSGSKSMVRFCKEQHIPHEICGKVIVATSQDELPRLEMLYRRGIENGVQVKKLTPGQVAEREPHVSCLGGILVPEAGIVDYAVVAARYLEMVREHGAGILFNSEVTGITESASSIVVETRGGPVQGSVLVNCGGLQSDRIARMAGLVPEGRIIPFRGEYYDVVPERKHLVKHLIYPVPNPDFPFLGVHFTRMIDGQVHAGPNAVLSLKREGYRRSQVSLRDLCDTLSFLSFWQLAFKHGREGAGEVMRSLIKKRFMDSLQKMIPDIQPDDVHLSQQAGIRAQMLGNDGRLVDDFLILRSRKSIHVCNAPSPAATASLEIGNQVADWAIAHFNGNPKT